MLRQHKDSLLRAERQGEATMKQHKAILIATIVLGAVIAAILVSRKDLCEVRIRTGHMEVAALMAYEPR